MNNGPINSARGARKICSIKDAIICDIGGTSSDAALLVKGLARESSTYIDLAGVQTDFRMHDTKSIALGGGSIITFNENKTSCKIGPNSVA